MTISSTNNQAAAATSAGGIPSVVSHKPFRSAGTECTTKNINNKDGSSNDDDFPTPPSSYCGGDCFYNNQVAINKFFFSSRLQMKRDLCCDDSVDNGDAGNDEEEEKAKKNAGAVAAQSLADKSKLANTEKSTTGGGAATASGGPIAIAEEGGRRQTKFSFFECEEHTDEDEEEEGDTNCAGRITESCSGAAEAHDDCQPLVTNVNEEEDAKEEDDRQTKFSFWQHTIMDEDVNTKRAGITADGISDGGRSAFRTLDPNNNNEKKQVRFVPIIDSLFEDSAASATACSFASSLTSLSSQERRFELIDLSMKNTMDASPPSSTHHITNTTTHLRLSTTQRNKILSNCRTYRLQISTFEELFMKEHGHLPQGSEERRQLASVYRQYREGKRSIRNDGACKLQALVRGVIVRMRLVRVAEKQSRKQKKNSRAKEKEKKEKENVAAAAASAVVVTPENANNKGSSSCEPIVPPPETIKEMAQHSINKLQSLKSELLTNNSNIKNSNTSSISNTNSQKFSFYTPPNDDDAFIYTPPKIEDKDWMNMAPELSKEIVAMCSTTATTPATAAATAGSSSSKPLPIKMGTKSNAATAVVPTTTTTTTTDTNQAGEEEDHQHHLTREMIVEHLTSDERTKIATKALSSKLINKGGYKLPDDTNDPNAICSTCEMPKLVSKTTGMALKDENCVVCDELYKKIVRKRNQRRKLGKKTPSKMMMMKSKKKDDTENERTMLKNIKQDLVPKRRNKKGQQPRIMQSNHEEEWYEEEEQYHRHRGMDWSSSVPSTLHLPAIVAVSGDSIDSPSPPPPAAAASCSTSSSTEEEQEHRAMFGFGEVHGGSRIIRSLQKEVTMAKKKKKKKKIASAAVNAVDAADAIEANRSSDDEDDDDDGSSDTFTTAKQEDNNKESSSPNANDEEEEKDEFDSLLDDASIEQLQRKIRNCPPPSEVELESAAAAAAAAAATAAAAVALAENEKRKKKKQSKMEAAAAAKSSKHQGQEVVLNKSSGGNQFASKSDYNNFQQLYGEFEKEHADVVEYVRDRVQVSISNKKKSGGHFDSHRHNVRSTSAPSLSSLGDSRDYDERHYHGGGGGRDGYRMEEGRRHDRHHLAQPKYREDHHRHRRHNPDHYSTDSVSELSQTHIDDEHSDYHRRHYRSHSRDDGHRRDRNYDRRRSHSRDGHGRHCHSHSRDRYASSGRHHRSGHSRDRYSSSRRRHHQERSNVGRRTRTRSRSYERRSSRSRSYERRRRRDLRDAKPSHYSTDYSSEYTPPTLANRRGWTHKH